MPFDGGYSGDEIARLERKCTQLNNTEHTAPATSHASSVARNLTSSVRIRPEPRVAVPISLRAGAELNSSTMKGYFYKKLQISLPAPEWLSLEHSVVLDHRVDVLDATTDDLEPLVPGHLQRGENSPARRL